MLTQQAKDRMRVAPSLAKIPDHMVQPSMPMVVASSPLSSAMQPSGCGSGPAVMCPWMSWPASRSLRIGVFLYPPMAAAAISSGYFAPQQIVLNLNFCGDWAGYF